MLSRETLTPLIHPNISEDNLLDDLFQQSSKGEHDIIDIMVSALHTSKYSGIQLAHLSKLRHIIITAGKTLNVISQRNVSEDT